MRVAGSPLFKYALNLIGLKAYGPGEKVAWWVNFTYRGEPASLAYEKFGLRLYLRTEAPEEEARKTQVKVAKQLRSSMRVVEKVILDAAPELLGNGNATVVNQHRSLRRAYEYFRERALEPTVIEDERSEYGPFEVCRGPEAVYHVQERTIQMQLNAFHDMIAAISAYVSLLEHDLVLALAFSGFDPAKDDLTDVIGSRWGDKFDRLLGKEGRRGPATGGGFTDVVERWRNPYSHGGFEKGQYGSDDLSAHAGCDGAVPVGLTRVRAAPCSIIPAEETDITEVFALFDEIKAFLATQLPEAMQWIDSGLDVRFDENFRMEQAQARQEDDFEGFLHYHEYQQNMIDNMDY